MKMNWKSKIALLAALAFALVSANAFAKEKVKIVYVEWACATASSHVMKAVIEQATDYEVVLTSVPAAVMFTALADGDQDAMVAAWLPVTHADYLKKYKDDIVDLGPNFEGAKIGLVVPEYVSIDSIAQLNENAKKFDGKIIGIDPGAGVMARTEKAIREYGLDKIQLEPSSGPIMTASLKNAYKNNQWVAVTGWVPHWKFATFKLKFLDDPKKVYGDAETINTFVRKGLKKDMPKVYRILDQFAWNSAQIGEVMAMNMAGGTPQENAEKWVKAHPEIVNKWLE